MSGQIIEKENLRGRSGVFRDRTHSGEVLAESLEDFRNENLLVLAIPAGGLPVALPISEALGAPLDVAVVSKITVPWNTEAGFGAIAFDGTCRLNGALVPTMGMSEEEIHQQAERTREKVVRRVREFRDTDDYPGLPEKTVVLVDDGLASGFTMLVAVEALRKKGAARIIVAVPTGHSRAVDRLAERVEVVCCPNIRGGGSFAVASAYQSWSDVSEADAKKMLKKYRRGKG